MAHTKPETIEDLKSELDKIRKLDGVREKSFGVFYLKSIPFMHFHNKDGERWADVKTPNGYQQVEIPFEAKQSDKKIFLKAVQDAHKILSQNRGKK